MKIQLIRNATMKITLAGKTILTDPVLLPRHGIESFAGIERNPIVDLPFPAEDVIKGADFVLVSHLHRDHFDDAAKAMLPKDLPVLCQPGDEERIRESGFSDVTCIDDSIRMGEIIITRTTGSHAGNQKWQDILGRVSGFTLAAGNEPTVYWAGDTILTDEVRQIIQAVQPDIILTHSCGAVLEDSGPIVMDANQTIEVCNIAPDATVVAVHLEALDHGTITRADVRSLANKNNIPDTRLLIPEDGKILEL